MNCIEGKILTDEGFRKGFILQRENETPSLHFSNPQKSSTKKRLIIPSFVNAHTHIGDSFIRQKKINVPHDLERLVAPPDGLKHKLLKTTDPQEIITGMKQGIQELSNEGITTFVDFRENGIAGIDLLKKALFDQSLNAIILGRPEGMHPTENEIQNILKVSDGIALSSLEDWDNNEVKVIAEQTEKSEKKFAIHASERIHEPITSILELHPSFLVHMNEASKKDLEKVKKQKIPIVVCPRSNHFFGLKSNIIKMKQVKNTILLGTDNFMLHSPSMISEIRYIQTTFPDLFCLEELLQMPTYQARKALNLKDNIPGSTLPRSWIILHPNTYQIESIIKKVEEG
jgi:cytosine/adenosine deaminase-related metal-dependent hydrolase